MSDNASQELQTAIHGLLYTSESDSPFEVVHWTRQAPMLTDPELRSLLGKSSDTHVEEVGLDDFFHDLTEDQEWHDSDDRKTVERYRHLLAVLKEDLKDLKVFKVGAAKIDVYIVGRTATGDWAGIKTEAVET